LLAGVLATGASAAPQPLTIWVDIGGGSVGGEVRANAMVEVIVRDASGRQVGRGFAEVYDGSWSFYDFPGVIASGYSIKATAFNTTGTLEVRQITVPQLTIAVDRTTDKVSGKGPAGKPVVINVSDMRWESWGESYDLQRKVNVNAAGRYASDFSSAGINIRGGAAASITWSNRANTVHVSRYADAPRIMLGLEYADFSGVVRRNVYVKATIEDAQSNVLAVGNAVGDSIGQFQGAFTNEQGDDVALRGGDWLSAPAVAPDVDWRVPTGIRSIDRATDKVYGKCFPNGRYQLYAVNPTTWAEGVKFGTAGPTGSFTRDMTSAINITSNTYVEVLCWTAEADYVWHGIGDNPNLWSARQGTTGRER
jgi:hypothetical protein